MLMSLFKRKTKQEIEIERKIAYQKLVNKLNMYIEECKRLSEKYWENGKKAASVGDAKMLREFATGYYRMQQNIKRAQRILLFLENVYLRKEEANLGVEIVKLMEDVSEDVKNSVDVKEITALEGDLSSALEKAEKAEISLTSIMDVLSNTILSSPETTEKDISMISENMGEEAFLEEQGLDEKIDEKIREIEEKMRESG